jgi:hypothetical protein
LRRRQLVALATASTAALLTRSMEARAAPRLDAFFGTYVGVAQSTAAPNEAIEQRDMDIVIAPYESSGFRITWTNVTLVHGRRDLPGVQRRVSQVIMVPGSGAGYFVEARTYNPFREQEVAEPMGGDPVQWAVLDDRGLIVYSFVIRDDGRYELQIYRRWLTKEGLDLHFERIVDDEVLRVIDGHTVRAE